ncbi:MAG TPA: molybdopterin-dependent oxidoreductase [Ignavibacteriales bacterium]|nr:molybdopterin-dependent oxidoreductase [Ignavibacteriales bacterium]
MEKFSGDRLSRRNFIKIAGAAGTALALSPGCDSVNKLIPYVNPPRYPFPGEWIHYNSVCRECPAGCGMLLSHRDGRITKADGNPKDPLNNGKLCARGQASMQGLYDPDRLKDVIRQNRGMKPEVSTWENALLEISERIKKNGTRVIIISNLQTGSLAEVIDTFASTAGNGSFAAYYEPFNYESLRKANEMLFGTSNVPHFNLDQADYIVSFAADYLETWISPIEYANRYGNMHSMNNGVIGKSAFAGPRMSLTAANSDTYIQTPAGKEGLVAFAMLKRINEKGVAKNSISQAMPFINSVLEGEKIPARDDEIERLVNDFTSASHGIALAGMQISSSDSQVKSALGAMLLNYSMGRIGSMVEFQRPHALSKTLLNDEVKKILSGISGSDVLILNNVNPVYTYPPSLDGIKKAGLVVFIGTQVDETASFSDWLLPANYYLESWGDYEPVQGMLTIMQPAMTPLYKTLSAGEIFLTLAHTGGKPLKRQPDGKTFSTFRDWFMDYWNDVQRQASPGTSGNTFLEDTLRTGGIWNFNTKEEEPVKISLAELKAGNKTPEDNALRLWLWPEITLFDGHLSNRGWLQEIAEPVSFISWNSWIDIHPALAGKYNLNSNDFLEVEAGNVKFKAPVNVTEIAEENTLCLPFGQGHTALGSDARGRGVNAYAISGVNMSNPITGIKIAKAGGSMHLAYMAKTKEQYGRKVVEWIGLSKLRQLKPEEVKELILPLPEGYQRHRDLYPARIYKEHRWAMVIDLQRCIGCAACTAACYAENNIPVVGETEVQKGREQTWIKPVPYRSDEDKKKLGWIPMLCQHCDAAPCEPVCPVFAAVHNEEGLNAQVYNRCIGTRYCSNNCPYKVRRFNWLNSEFKSPLEVQLNPEVTVRSRGVMEKCTFCVQRIRNAEYHAENEKRKLKEGEIITACQQTCPTNAIIFGDLLDNNSQVTKLTRGDLRRYHLLEELNTKPAVTYLKRINMSES